ncbi:uncharacterized protein METZ01_LOCUS468575 [marine metagenome]|uniref:Uncharacterized protein n=1 Tax=marine metagenome TaxID=408172 RepID=A0A383B776_9ZZZZ
MDVIGIDMAAREQLHLKQIPNFGMKNLKGLF